MNGEALMQAMESLAADVLFGVIVLVSFGIVLLALLFGLLLLRNCWRWLLGHTWNDVVASAGRKALK
jgi:hypothetical protein